MLTTTLHVEHRAQMPRLGLTFWHKPPTNPRASNYQQLMRNEACQHGYNLENKSRTDWPEIYSHVRSMLFDFHAIVLLFRGEAELFKLSFSLYLFSSLVNEGFLILVKFSHHSSTCSRVHNRCPLALHKDQNLPQNRNNISYENGDAIVHMLYP